VTDGQVAARLVDDAVALMGGLDILINNAGAMFGRTAITDEQYAKVLDQYRRGVFASRRAAAIMQAQGHGAIINIPSIAARTGGAGLYGSAKGFVSTIIRVLAKELAASGVWVNDVAPGVITTPSASAPRRASS
jgi:3-oxoacyl-[acyl-carrier protein] reductase